MGGEPGDHRNAEPVQVIGELVQIGTIDAGIDQDQPTLPAHRDGIAQDPRALPDPDAVGHLIQHRFTLSGISARAQEESPLETGRKARSWYFDGQECPRAEIVGRWFTTLLWFSVVVGLPEMRGRSVSSQAWPKLVSI